jgi:heptosyltransferase-1
VLPSGTDDERARAQELARHFRGACVAPPLELAALAGVLAGAAAAIGVDTGLAHLAAALKVPVVGIYGPTDPACTGLYADGPAVNLGGHGRFPGPDEVMSALRGLTAIEQCAQGQEA